MDCYKYFKNENISNYSPLGIRVFVFTVPSGIHSLDAWLHITSFKFLLDSTPGRLVKLNLPGHSL